MGASFTAKFGLFTVELIIECGKLKLGICTSTTHKSHSTDGRTSGERHSTNHSTGEATLDQPTNQPTKRISNEATLH